MKKQERLTEIKRIIRNERPGNQDELLNILLSRGFSLTQATLSRDLKRLKAGKITDESGNYVYVLPGESLEKKLPVNDTSSVMTSGFVSISFSLNMAVIKTLPGFASGIALGIDKLKAYEIVGTIAGDDTILIIAREDIEREDLVNSLRRIIPQV